MFNKKEYNKKLKENNIKKGMCRNHSNIPVVEGKNQCQKCLNVAKLRTKRASLKALKNNKCQRCINRDIVPGKTLCKECIWNGILSQAHLSREQASKILSKQKNICPISGRILIPGINASPDHIINIGSKNRKNKNHPLNKPENIRFVDTHVQYAKWTYSDEELLQLVKDIYNHNEI